MKKEDFPLSAQEIENAHRVAYLIAGYIRETLTPTEHRELDVWVAGSDRNMELFEELTDEDNLQQALQWHQSLDTEAALQRLKSRLPGSVAPPVVAGGSRLHPGSRVYGHLPVLRCYRAHRTTQNSNRTAKPRGATGGVLLTTADGQALSLNNKGQQQVAGDQPRHRHQARWIAGE